MSMPDPPRTPARPPSAAAGYAVVFVIGLVFGLFLLVTALRAVESRKTWQDHYPGAVMQLYQAHMAQLDRRIADDRCARTDTQVHFESLRGLSNDLEPAFPGLRDHRGFVPYADQTRRTLDAALASLPTGCAALETTLRAVRDTCDACHRDFRN